MHNDQLTYRERIKHLLELQRRINSYAIEHKILPQELCIMLYNLYIDVKETI